MLLDVADELAELRALVLQQREECRGRVGIEQIVAGTTPTAAGGEVTESAQPPSGELVGALAPV